MKADRDGYTTVRIPVFDTAGGIEAWFRANGIIIDGCICFEDHAFVHFFDRCAAERFAQRWKHEVVEGHNLEVEILPHVGSARSRTVVVYDVPDVTERKLWDNFWQVGYLQEVEVVGDVGYMQFSTEAEASRAVEKCRELCLGEADFIRDRALNVPDVHIVFRERQLTGLVSR